MNISNNLLWKLLYIFVSVVGVGIFSWLCYKFRDWIKTLIKKGFYGVWVKRKVIPKFNKYFSSYKEEEKDYIETEPEIKLEEIDPKRKEFGVIFIKPGEKNADDVLIQTIPVATSLGKIRFLLDCGLRKALFDRLAFNLAIKEGKLGLAEKYEQLALKDSPCDWEIICKLDEKKALENIIFQDAIRRLEASKGKIYPSDRKELSKLARELSKEDFFILLVGEKSIDAYINYCKNQLKKWKGVLILARGSFISTAVDVANRLKKEQNLIEWRTSEREPIEIDTWRFTNPEAKERRVSCMRIWLKKETKLDI